MIWDGWQDLWRILMVGSGAYAGLVLLLRVSGNRTLSKMNAFDLVVTVALGSTLATVLLSRDVSLSEGLSAFALLIVLQYAVTWASVRSGRIHRLVKSEPVLIARAGRTLPDAMRAQRVTGAELLAALRSQGMSDLSGVDAVVLETDGTFSVLRNAAGDQPRPAEGAAADTLSPLRAPPDRSADPA